jgi:glycerophosphoryl diester phosphodiesterase
VQLRRDGGRPLAIGHRGAPRLAPENTLASLQAAVAAGVDVVEFDVLERGGELVLAHSVRETAEEP